MISLRAPEYQVSFTLTSSCVEFGMELAKRFTFPQKYRELLRPFTAQCFLKYAQPSDL